MVSNWWSCPSDFKNESVQALLTVLYLCPWQKAKATVIAGVCHHLKAACQEWHSPLVYCCKVTQIRINKFVQFLYLQGWLCQNYRNYLHYKCRDGSAKARQNSRRLCPSLSFFVCYCSLSPCAWRRLSHVKECRDGITRVIFIYPVFLHTAIPTFF